MSQEIAGVAQRILIAVRNTIMLLDQLPTGQRAEIAAIDWSVLPSDEGKRLRALGVDEGASVTIRHRGIFFGRDPIALSIGRMTVAIRRVHARAITLRPLEAVPADLPEAAE
ncbi:ferrous iron transport protein A [Blastomonas sp.]|uniref:FeoA family protein n=1 Tax=Blastomonas sp. TaxID=1909299 RepID=UPI00345D4B6A